MTRIIGIEFKKGVSIEKAYDIIKQAMGYTSNQEASKFFETMMGHYEYELEEVALPFLIQVFDFKINTNKIE